MKRSNATVCQKPVVDPYMDEAMAMVYVGDVYSLVVQEGTPAVEAEKKAEKTTESQDDSDVLWPFIR